MCFIIMMDPNACEENDVLTCYYNPGWGMCVNFIPQCRELSSSPEQCVLNKHVTCFWDGSITYDKCVDTEPGLQCDEYEFDLNCPDFCFWDYQNQVCVTSS